MKPLAALLIAGIVISSVHAFDLPFFGEPATGIDWDKTTISNELSKIPVDDIATRQERINQGIAAKVQKAGLPISISVSKNNPMAVNLSPKGDYYIRIDSIEYEKSTGTLKTYIYATRDGIELDIRNPVRFYGMGYTFSPDPGAANIMTNKRNEKGDYIWNAYEEENPRLAILSSVYSFLQTREYGKVINDGSDPTVVIYPSVDGSAYHIYSAGITHTLLRDNTTGIGIASIPETSLSGSGTKLYNYTTMYRPIFDFNMSPLQFNITVSSVNFYFYIYNTSTINDKYYYSTNYPYGYYGWTKYITSLNYGDYDTFDTINFGSNATPTNVTGLYTYIRVTNPDSVFKNRHNNYVTFFIRGTHDINSPNRWSYGKKQGYQIYSVTYAGTSYDPFLTIEYTVNDICPATTTCPTVTTTPVCAAPATEEGRMPVSLMYLLIPLAAGLSLFSVGNLTNRVYANIVLGGIAASILWFFLAANVITGNIFLHAEDRGCIMIDTPLFWLFVLFGVIMTVYTLAMAIEAILERREVIE